MFTIFGIEFIIYAYFAYTANNFESWFLYNFCLESSQDLKLGQYEYNIFKYLVYGFQPQI